MAAGLAGGSSDAAAVLLGVNRIFGLGLSREELMERGVKLGADIPFCIMRGTVLAEGIGEKLTKLPGAPSCQFCWQSLRFMFPLSLYTEPCRLRSCLSIRI